MTESKKRVERPWWKRPGYFLVWSSSRLCFTVFYGLRVVGLDRLPKTGGVLVCSNHQSHFDPLLVGSSLNRRLNYLARRTLFDVPVIKWLIAYLDAIPLERSGLGIAGIKETLRRLKRGEPVLIFPEGTRSSDGEIAPLKPGFCALARRSGCPLLPVAIDGAYQAWPKSQKFPSFRRIAMVVGEPIMPEEIAGLNDDDLVAELQRRLVACHGDAARLRSGRSA